MADPGPPVPLAVLDCNVYAQALISRGGPAARVVADAFARRFRLVLSDVAVREILELPDKLSRRLRVTPARAERFVRELLDVAELVAVVPPVFAYGRDPDDANYVDLAVAAGAGYLVTRDKDLLDLAADTPEGRAFAARFPALRVIDPVAFLSLLLDVQP